MRRIIAFLIDFAAIGAVSAVVWHATQSTLWVIASQVIVMSYSVWCYYDGSTR